MKLSWLPGREKVHEVPQGKLVQQISLEGDCWGLVVFDSFINLCRGDISARDCIEVLSQDVCALAGTTAHIHCCLQGSSILRVTHYSTLSTWQFAFSCASMVTPCEEQDIIQAQNIVHI